MDEHNVSDTIKDIDFIFENGGLINQIKQDYSPRPSQIKAAKIIYEALNDSNHVVLEGPCGFGKTFAYLVPALINCIESSDNGKKRIVIATNGISLQEQLYYKDIPFVARLMKTMYGKNIKYAMLKGKGNFICKQKINEVDVSMKISGKDTKKIADLYRKGKIKNGDISNLNFSPDFNSLSEVCCVENGECLGSSCSAYNDCHYQVAKIKSHDADVVVTNYHMLFSDLQTQGKILGSYDILILDEAHEIANIYRDFLEEKFSHGTIIWFRNKFAELGNKDKVLKDRFLKIFDMDAFIRSAEDYFEKVKMSLFFDVSKDGLKVIDNTTPLCIYKESENEFKVALNALGLTVNKLREFCNNKIESMLNLYGNESEIPKEEKNEYDKYKSMELISSLMCSKIISIQSMIFDYQELVEDDNVVFWVENNGGQISINSKPVNVADKMYNKFFGKTNLSCVLTSATLSVNKNFEYIKRQLGLDLISEEDDKHILEYIGESPFNLTEQELWYLPLNAIDGDSKNSKEFRQTLPRHIIDILQISNGGALCLFTSYANLNYAYDVVSREMPNLNLLKQGSMPKLKLIEEFKKDQNSVLFATRSFFTGVDVPGNSLRALIIDKFPFPNPADPVMMKIRKIYGGKTFTKCYIPEMVIDLKQAVGRGIRTIDDKCLITILDGRMSTARYKGSVFASFPYEKTGTRDINDVKLFFENFSK